MDIWDTNKLVIFIAFVIPGFLSMKLYSVLHPNVQLDTSKTVIEVVTYSCINYAIWLIPIYLFEKSQYGATHLITYMLFYLCVLFVSPIILTLLFVWMRSWKWLCNLLPHPTGRAWDYYFGLRMSSWVIVTLKDGNKIAGKYSADSFSSSSPNPEQLYLEENWVINADGGFERARTDTLGILILSKDIEHIEFFRFTNPSENSQEGDNSE
ncbi:MAG TPA: hypothetical protein DEF87_16855 [Enterobacter asburiae]|jgi:hypothetical protein|uniref:DUF6338 family protein n=1 Tax=Enterobacter TaxID=547 RepID=UPI000668FE8C|nr:MULTISPECIES: DUF6338 family protein [Enterobacter cloacae complex]MDU4303772.1 DUF6338 family protein [Enterococcus faecalis]MBG0650619.1 hypothetical protein [Enterobacter asburiae]MCD2510238.1 DUF6338 family protein [Enterobacter kobei]MCK6655901.1 DUF6338 family protein [Enterobacter asburiae]MDU5045031.1 DUF6338 family protein [Enterobacter roggenkampii]